MTTSYNDYLVENNSQIEPIILVGLDADGNPFETKYERLEYDEIPEDVYNQEIVRFQRFFLMKRPERFMVPNEKGDLPDPYQTKTRLEIMVVDGPLQGAIYYPLYSVAFGENATLGKLIRAITQKPIPTRFNPLSLIGLQFKSYVQHGKDQKTGIVKLGKDGKPFAEPAIGTVKPIQGNGLARPGGNDDEGVPTELRTIGSAKKVTTVPVDDPRVSWDAFWTWAGRWGFKRGDRAAISQAIKRDFDALSIDEVYDLLDAAVKNPAKAPF